VTPQETVTLARYVRALCPQQRFDEYTPDAWHDVLGAHRLDDARQACANLAARQPFISPAEIVAEVRRIRGARLGDTPPAYDPPRGDETGAEYVARRRAQLAAIGDGREQPLAIGALTGGPHPDVAARLRQLGDIPPAVRDAVAPRTRTVLDGKRVDGPERLPRDPALAVDCPRVDCRALRNRPCKRPSGNELHSTVHHQRQDAYAAALTAQEMTA
jgi:hypothetical protein